MPYLTLKSSYADAMILLDSSSEVVFPVVQDHVSPIPDLWRSSKHLTAFSSLESSQTDMLLLGAVMRSELRQAIKSIRSVNKMVQRLQRHPSMRNEMQETKVEVAKELQQSTNYDNEILFAFNRGGRFYNLVS